MTSQSPLLIHIGLAEEYVGNARQSWDPSNLRQCFECSSHLDQAIEEMKAACEAAAGGPVPPGTKARLGRLRGEVEVLSRLVDSAIAFGRGLMIRDTGAPAIAAELRG